VSARFLLGIFDSVYVLSLAAWVGAIAFFWFAVVPIVGSTLGAEAAERVVRALSPRYYAWGATAGAIALPAFIAGPLCYPEFRGPSIGLQAMLILGAILLTFYAGNAPSTTADAAGKAGPEADAPARRPRPRSTALNMAVLAIGVGLLIAFANRPAPQTTGILEPSPAERIRLEAEAAARRDATSPDANPARRPGGDPQDLAEPK
jgi:hypothetical protein